MQGQSIAHESMELLLEKGHFVQFLLHFRRLNINRKEHVRWLMARDYRKILILLSHLSLITIWKATQYQNVIMQSMRYFIDNRN